MPVIDVDRVTIRYGALDRLVSDLRGSALTNQLAARPTRYPGKTWRQRLVDSFAATDANKATEKFEYLHFLAWTPA